MGPGIPQMLPAGMGPGTGSPRMLPVLRQKLPKQIKNTCRLCLFSWCLTSARTCRTFPAPLPVPIPSLQIGMIALSSWREANSKVPTRMWEPAIRVRMAPGNSFSRWTFSPVATTAKLRVVGIPRPCMASLMRYSRSIGPRAARPSPPRE